jgi:hypothetical protein
VWSAGEVAGVAAILSDHDILGGGETVQSVWARWSFDLWGVTARPTWRIIANRRDGGSSTELRRSKLPCTHMW